VVAAKTTWAAELAMALMGTMAAPVPLILAPAVVEVRARQAATGLAELVLVLVALAALVCLTRILAPVCFMAGAVAALPCRPALAALVEAEMGERLLVPEAMPPLTPAAAVVERGAPALAAMAGPV
jgi:hypothetical protein